MIHRNGFRNLRDLVCANQGISAVEFALMLPLLVLVGAGGLELTNLVLANQKVERIASVTADNVARNTLAPSEQSFADTFEGVDEIAAPFDFYPNGRIIMTGVIGIPENGSVVPKVVWQRCRGQLAGAISDVGKEAKNPALWADGDDAKLPNNIKLLQNQLVVISEVSYRYEPLISLSQLPGNGEEKIARQRSIFVSRGQAFPYVTPTSGLVPSKCS